MGYEREKEDPRAGRREGPARRADGWTDGPTDRRTDGRTDGAGARRVPGEGLTRGGCWGARYGSRAGQEGQRKVPREQDRPLALVLRGNPRPPGAVKLKIYARRRLRRLTLRPCRPPVTYLRTARARAFFLFFHREPGGRADRDSLHARARRHARDRSGSRRSTTRRDVPAVESAANPTLTRSKSGGAEGLATPRGVASYPG